MVESIHTTDYYSITTITNNPHLVRWTLLTCISNEFTTVEICWSIIKHTWVSSYYTTKNWLEVLITCKKNKLAVEMPNQECKVYTCGIPRSWWYWKTAYNPTMAARRAMKFKVMWTNFCLFLVAGKVLYVMIAATKIPMTSCY